MKRLRSTIVLLIVSAACGSAALSQGSPEDLIKRLRDADKVKSLDKMNPAELERFFSRDAVARLPRRKAEWPLILEDDMPDFTAVPIGPRSLTVASSQVKFSVYGEEREFRYEMVNDGERGWRITEIIGWFGKAVEYAIPPSHDFSPRHLVEELLDEDSASMFLLKKPTLAKYFDPKLAELLLRGAPHELAFELDVLNVLTFGSRYDREIGLAVLSKGSPEGSPSVLVSPKMSGDMRALRFEFDKNAAGRWRISNVLYGPGYEKGKSLRSRLSV